MSRLIGELSKAVGDVSDRLADTEGTLGDARRRWLEGSRPKEAPRRAPWFLAAACVALALIVALALPRSITVVAPRSSDKAISFQLGARQGVVGDWIAADEGAVDLRFSEGTRVRVQPVTRMRVTSVDAHGAELLIEHGSTHTEFEPRPAARWLLRAGPFAIHVTGTKFDTKWDPAGEVLELSMIEGSVVVDGPLLPPGRRVVGGETLVVSLKDHKMELRTYTADSTTVDKPGEYGPPATEASEPQGAAIQHLPVAVPSASTRSAEESADEEDWRKLVHARRYRDALARIEAAGADQEIERASAEELLLLSDAARFGGRPALAKRSLLAARERLGVTGRTAFLLGKIAAEQLQDPAQASRWFETYLREQPEGPLADQALGRLIELKRSADPTGAKELAERYLAKYPGGAYAALARSLVSP